MLADIEEREQRERFDGAECDAFIAQLEQRWQRIEKDASGLDLVYKVNENARVASQQNSLTYMAQNDKNLGMNGATAASTIASRSTPTRR